MKKYIVINGSTVTFVLKKDMEEAVIYATNNCDHSKEIIVREVKEVINPLNL